MHDNPDRDADERRGKPPLSVRMADEGNIPGRPSTAALAVIVAIVVVGLAAIYIFNQ